MTVRVERRTAVTVITIDRPDKRNAIDGATTLALDAAFNEFADDDSVLVAVLTGGPAFFCAGTDIVAWAGPPTERGGPYGIARRDLHKPLIAAVEGVAAGGGFEIALAATLIVASSSAHLLLPRGQAGSGRRVRRSVPGPAGAPAQHRPGAAADRSAADGRAGLRVRRGEPADRARAGPDRGHRAGRRRSRAGARSRCGSRWPPSRRLRRAPTAPAGTAPRPRGTHARSSADATEGVAAFTERRPPGWTGR